MIFLVGGGGIDDFISLNLKLSGPHDTARAPQSLMWASDIAIKEKSPFRLFSTVDVCLAQ